MTLTFTTTVMPGGEIRVQAPQLAEGQAVTVSVELLEAGPLTKATLMSWLDALPATRTAEEWDQFERDFREGRDSWDR
jgi:hypothetical protein